MAPRKWNRDNWPIAAAMIQYPNLLPDGRSVQDQPVEEWAATLADVVDAGFTELDPTDSWIRLADLSAERLDQFVGLTRSLGLTIPAISTSRRSLIDPEHGEEYLAYGHRVVEAAAAVGAGSVSFGFFGPLTEAQKKVLWFWTVDGVKNPDDAGTWQLAVSRVRELGRHAEELGIEVSLEMYEDTYLGTADSSVRFVQEVGLANVGINADLGNLIRLHRPVEHWQEMMAKVAPFAKYWHVKNYNRTEDPASGVIVTHPAPLEFGLINYRAAIRMALAHGFDSPFLCEHYGGDGLSVSAANRDYLRRILPRQEGH
ncbi:MULTISPECIES: sugar phosphate isomerase/epimerase family protein [Sinorhizobium]|jgi:sugar phosphate isomerase/epimerase|uniref:Xylose isomerase n=1 Tax=Rhizobium meliloti TaxID=382 RepID=A0A2J0Z5U3_RHIML|nr:sugar phosphate isomerase/epimerase family protein [Sinorhizobium meliloti]PND21551.1 xylose isomerase [Ensifer sp. MMN_5]GCA50980.1 xylose isomerase-like TIM barrel [Sinorhizobium sp. KGO-5]MCG5483049.1 sugar phosphate isomerase/epimerase [Sinorhizobium meliloti]PJR15828.1 xylose isomerase [Sinorhizobium meliloti]WRQ70747.1 sugar phosphate isomerase/epimerase family protein [Sinorhizobium meliloti]